MASDDTAPHGAATPADDLADLEAAYKAATPGPWRVLSDDKVDASWLNADGEADRGAIALYDYRTAPENKANAQLSALLVDRLPKLLDELRQLRIRNRQLLEANGREVDRRTQALRERDEALARLGESRKDEA